jgi:hypothetical protein
LQTEDCNWWISVYYIDGILLIKSDLKLNMHEYTMFMNMFNKCFVKRLQMHLDTNF